MMVDKKELDGRELLRKMKADTLADFMEDLGLKDINDLYNMHDLVLKDRATGRKGRR